MTRNTMLQYARNTNLGSDNLGESRLHVICNTFSIHLCNTTRGTFCGSYLILRLSGITASRARSRFLAMFSARLTVYEFIQSVE